MLKYLCYQKYAYTPPFKLFIVKGFTRHLLDPIKD